MSSNRPFILFQLTDHQNIVTWENLVSVGAEEKPSDEDHSTNQQPFDNLNELMCHQAHLAVFLNFMISNSDPAALVRFYHGIFLVL